MRVATQEQEMKDALGLEIYAIYMVRMSRLKTINIFDISLADKPGIVLTSQQLVCQMMLMIFKKSSAIVRICDSMVYITALYSQLP